MALTLTDDLVAVATAVGVLRDSRPPLMPAITTSGTLPDNVVSIWDVVTLRRNLFGPITPEGKP